MAKIAVWWERGGGDLTGRRRLALDFEVPTQPTHPVILGLIIHENGETD